MLFDIDAEMTALSTRTIGEGSHSCLLNARPVTVPRDSTLW